MSDQEKDKEKVAASASTAAADATSAPVPGAVTKTPSALLQEWLESEGFAVQTSGLRRSNLVGRDIDELLAKNAVTRLTLSLMYATDFFDQVEHRVLPALRSGTVVLADRFIFTLIARG